MLRSTKLSVESVCGTYDWICHWDILFDHVYHSNCSDPFNGGYLTLSPKPDCDVTPENISGSIRIWSQNGNFESMVACPVANNWDFSVQWEEGAPMKDESGHGIEVLNVLDDNGNYFLMFLYDGGSIRGVAQHYSKFIGKKRVDDDSERFLTRAEWDRFAMNLSWDEAEELWIKERRGVSTTGSHGESEAENDVDDEEVAEHQTIEPLETPVAGTKRKAEHKEGSSKRQRATRKK